MNIKKIKIQRMNKKGSILDPIIWIVLAIVTIFILAGFLYMFNQLNTELRSIDTGSLNMTDIADDTITPVNSALNTWMPILAYIIIFTSIISIFIHNYLIKSHPLFIAVYIVLGIVAIIVSVYISNFYVDFLSNEVLGSTLERFTGANFIMTWLPYIVTIINAIGTILLFLGLLRNDAGGVTL